jgi:hypothetical protein
MSDTGRVLAAAILVGAVLFAVLWFVVVLAT